MSNDDSRYDISSLDDDNDFATPLRRVSFQAGMLLGVDATQAEQEYHRRRLTRHQYWFQGYGTLVGMAVVAKGSDGNEAPDESLTVNVSPGVGIDGLGREVMVTEPYCINLHDWLETQTETDLAPGVHRNTDNDLRLVVSVRYDQCASGLQPTMATRLNDTTDPVAPSRVKDCILLEISPSRSDPATPPWLAHDLVLGESQDEKFSTPEKAELNALSEEEKEARTYQARLVYAMTKDGDADEQPSLKSEKIAEEAARIPLAEIRIKEVTDLAKVMEKLNMKNVQVNNLIRPFINTNAQIAQRTLL